MFFRVCAEIQIDSRYLAASVRSVHTHSSFSGILKHEPFGMHQFGYFQHKVLFFCMPVATLFHLLSPHLTLPMRARSLRSLRAVGSMLCCTFQYNKNWIHSRFVRTMLIHHLFYWPIHIYNKRISGIDSILSLHVVVAVCKRVNTRALFYLITKRKILYFCKHTYISIVVLARRIQSDKCRTLKKCRTKIKTRQSRTKNFSIHHILQSA